MPRRHRRVPQLWDIAGQDRFARLTRAYFNKAKGAIVVCDVTREGTFEAAGEWKKELDRVFKENGDDIPVFLVANKCDLIDNMEASFIAGAKMEKACVDNGFMGWFVTSAKSGVKIQEAMGCLIEKMREMFPPKGMPGPEQARVRRRTPKRDAAAETGGPKSDAAAPVATPRGFKLINPRHQPVRRGADDEVAGGCC